VCVCVCVCVLVCLGVCVCVCVCVAMRVCSVWSCLAKSWMYIWMCLLCVCVSVCVSTLYGGIDQFPTCINKRVFTCVRVCVRERVNLNILCVVLSSNFLFVRMDTYVCVFV